jgi:hypothetical protein
MASPDSSPQKRRWFQYSLRTLLLVMLLASIGTSWLAYRATRQRDAVAAILRAGGGVIYSYEYDAAGKIVSDPEPPAPEWLRNVLGIDYFSRVTDVHLAGDSITDTDLEVLECLPGLRTLIVAGPGVTDAGLVHLSRLRRLEQLQLGGAGITDAGLIHLHPLRELNQLTLDCSVTDAGMRHLLPLKNLRKLISRGCDGNRERVKIFSELDAPTTIQMMQAPLPDVCAYLSDLHAIKVDIDEGALEEAKIEWATMPVTCDTNNTPGVSLGIALDSMLEPLGLAWIVGENSVVITTRETVARKHNGVGELQAALPQLKEVYVDW